MKLALLLLTLVAQGQTPPDMATYSNKGFGMSFTHPKSWQVTTDKKNDSKIVLPVEGSSIPARLEIMNASFTAEKDIWQQSQLTIYKGMRREVVRQWEEELLGVPLLLTKVSFSDKEGPHTQVSGLLYSKTPRKMWFRLTAAPEDFDKADFEFRQALQSIKTFDGKVPAPEDGKDRYDGSKPLPPPPIEIKKPTILSGANGGTGEAVKAPVTVEMTVAARKVLLRLPEGWAAKADGEGGYTLTHPELTGLTDIFVASTLDSDPPERALFKVSSVSLQDFKQVKKRDDVLAAFNKANVKIAQVWRTGTALEGGKELATGEAVGATGDFYFVMTYRSPDTTKTAAERKVIGSLLDVIGLEVTP